MKKKNHHPKHRCLKEPRLLCGSSNSTSAIFFARYHILIYYLSVLYACTSYVLRPHIQHHLSHVTGTVYSCVTDTITLKWFRARRRSLRHSSRATSASSAHDLSQIRLKHTHTQRCACRIHAHARDMGWEKMCDFTEEKKYNFTRPRRPTTVRRRRFVRRPNNARRTRRHDNIIILSLLLSS